MHRIINLISASIAWLIHSLLSIIKVVISLLLGLIFIVIPTLTFNPRNQIPFIEKDLCIDFPKDYKITDKYADYLIFESHEEITFKFNDNEYAQLLKQIKNNNCENGKWTENNETFEVENTIEVKQSTTNEYDYKYIYKAVVSTKDKTLKYYYSNL